MVLEAGTPLVSRVASSLQRRTNIPSIDHALAAHEPTQVGAPLPSPGPSCCSLEAAAMLLLPDCRQAGCRCNSSPNQRCSTMWSVLCCKQES